MYLLVTSIPTFFYNMANGRNLFHDFGEGILYSSIVEGISGGISVYDNSKSNGINPWNGKIERTRITHSNVVKTPLQPDITKNCYAYAGEHVASQLGIDLDHSDFLNATNYADGYDFTESIKLIKNKATCLKTFSDNISKGVKLEQFSFQFDSHKWTAAFSVEILNNNRHVVVLSSYDTVKK